MTDPNEVNAAVGRALRAMRRSRNVTQGEVAQVMGTTQAAISNYENGHRTPDVAVVHRYANALGASPIEVFEMANIERLSPPMDFVERAKRLADKINERSPSDPDRD